MLLKWHIWTTDWEAEVNQDVSLQWIKSTDVNNLATELVFGCLNQDSGEAGWALL